MIDWLCIIGPELAYTKSRLGFKMLSCTTPVPPDPQLTVRHDSLFTYSLPLPFHKKEQKKHVVNGQGCQLLAQCLLPFLQLLNLLIGWAALPRQDHGNPANCRSCIVCMELPCDR